MSIYLVIFLTLLAALLSSYSQSLFKSALSKKLNSLRDIIGTLKNRTVLLGFAGYAISLVVYLEALSRAPLSVVYPTFASCFIFVTIISAYKFKEKISIMRVAGVLLIFLGIVIVALSV